MFFTHSFILVWFSFSQIALLQYPFQSFPSSRSWSIIYWYVSHRYNPPHHFHQIDPTRRAFRCKIGTESKSTGDGNATASIFLEVRFNSKLMHIYTYIYVQCTYIVCLFINNKIFHKISFPYQVIKKNVKNENHTNRRTWEWH